MGVREDQISSVLNKLRSALGTGEDPAGSNWNFIVEWYNNNVERIGRGAWCEMTNTWSVWTSGFKALKRGRAYTVWAAQDGQNAVNGSAWYWGTGGIQAGDQLYFDWDARKGNVAVIDHTGTVEQVNNDGTFWTLEGNSDDQLRRVLRDSKFVVGYVRLNYGNSAPAPAPTPVPVPVSPTHIDEDGQLGPQTIRRLQAVLNQHGANPHLDEDGGFGPKSKRALQAYLGVAVDGDFGRNSVSALQRKVGAHVDGDWGSETTLDLQRALNAGRF